MNFSILIWISLRLISPMDFDVKPNLSSMIIILSYLLSFYLGTYFYSIVSECGLHKNCEDSIILNKNAVNKIYKVLFFISILGIILRYYDLIVIKQYFSYGSATDFRLRYDQESTDYGFISIVSSVLYPVVVFFCLYTIYFKNALSRFKVLNSYVLLLLFFAYFVMRGGRTIITLVVIMLFIASILFNSNRSSIKMKNKSVQKKKAKILMIALFFAACFYFLSMEIVLDRLTAQGFTIYSHLSYMEQVHHIKLHRWAWDLAYKNDFLAANIYTVVSLTYYFLHGFYQFILLANYFEIDNIVYGASQFFPIVKLLNVIGIKSISYSYLNSIVNETGVYTTFFGPVLIDFGWFGFLYCYILGMISQYFYSKARRSNIVHLLIYPYIGSVIFHSPFINMIQAGMGLFVLISGIIVAFIIKKMVKGNKVLLL